LRSKITRVWLWLPRRWLLLLLVAAAAAVAAMVLLLILYLLSAKVVGGLLHPCTAPKTSEEARSAYSA
jgi:hypothetical protein